MNPPTSFSFKGIVLDFLHSHVNLEQICQFFKKQPSWILIGVMLNLQINLRRIWYHLIRSLSVSMISLSTYLNLLNIFSGTFCSLQFGHHLSYMKFIPRYFVFYFIFKFFLFLLVYRNRNNVCILTLFSEILLTLHSLIKSRSFC